MGQVMGERNGLAKLSDKQVQAIHSMRRAGASFQEIAQAIGCSVRHVRRIIKGESRTSAEVVSRCKQCGGKYTGRRCHLCYVKSWIAKRSK